MSNGDSARSSSSLRGLRTWQGVGPCWRRWQQQAGSPDPVAFCATVRRWQRPHPGTAQGHTGSSRYSGARGGGSCLAVTQLSRPAGGL